MVITRRKQRLSAKAKRLISPSDLRRRAQKLIAEGKMPSLTEVLRAVKEVREKHSGIPVKDDMLLKVMKAYGNPNPTREEYIALKFAGTLPLDGDGELPAELEAELPAKFQRAALDENVISDAIQ